MRAVTLVLAVLALTLGTLATPALAGGWAVTTFDELPGQFVSGHEYTLGYTIRQHGVTPINVDKTEILAVATSGRTLSFPGKSQGGVGHYVASVFFPAGGTYTWQVTQGAFAPQDLGAVTILAAAGTTSDKAAAADKTALDKAAADKALPADKAAALDKAAAAEKAAVADKAAVLSSAVAAPAPAPATQSGDPVRSALPFAAAAAAAMFIWRLVTMLRTTRRTRASA